MASALFIGPVADLVTNKFVTEKKHSTGVWGKNSQAGQLQGL